ncbi:unnamed protein product [Rhizophagus irregularis]|nr:unnamed protein product [Rhizophagus irregularis]
MTTTQDNYSIVDFLRTLQDPAPQYVLGCGPAVATIVDEQDDDVIKLLEECIAEASVLDRLSSLASAYYIFLGIITGLIKAMRIGQPCPKEDWPYLPLALAWTLPAIYKRVYGGRMVVNDPRDRLKDMHLVVSDLKHRESHKRSARVAQVMIILLFSIIIHWISVLLAYFTFPVGYGCRSKYLTVLSSIWSFNNLIAYISHIIGERSVEGLLSHTQSWWKDLFGNICDDAARCKM